MNLKQKFYNKMNVLNLNTWTFVCIAIYIYRIRKILTWNQANEVSGKL